VKKIIAMGKLQRAAKKLGSGRIPDELSHKKNNNSIMKYLIVKDPKNNQQNEEKGQCRDDANKCRCCFSDCHEDNTKIAISEQHQEIFRSMMNVELRMDLVLSAFICSICDNKMNKISEFVQVVGKVQRKFYEFIADVGGNKNYSVDALCSDISNEFQPGTEKQELCSIIKIEKEQFTVEDSNATLPSNDLCLKQCFVRLDRLDENIIKKYRKTSAQRSVKESFNMKIDLRTRKMKNTKLKSKLH